MKIHRAINTWLVAVQLLLVGFVWYPPIALVEAATSGGISDPYKVLGVTETASQDDIKKRYRELCLKYHPDKNVNKPTKQREEYERRFKTIQKANNLIGTVDARKEYDRMKSSPFYRPDMSSSTGFTPATSTTASSSSPETPFDEATDLFFRAFGMNPYRTTSTTATPSFHWRSPIFGDVGGLGGLSTLKSIYIQRVKVPLEDLYTGAQGLEFHVNDSWWKRYRAAFRGGAAIINFYQALVYGLPLLRLSKFVALAAATTIFHRTLPRPVTKTYHIDLQPGYKGGKTKLAFRSNNFAEPEVIFELEEERHERFTRIDNDLHTTVTITSTQAKNGCTVQLDPLDDDEPIIEIILQPNQVQKSGDIVRVIGRGWPIRNTKHLTDDDGQTKHMSGDLIVRVVIKNKRRNRKTS